MKKIEAKVGMKVHTLGRGSVVLYIIEIGDNTAGVSADKNATSCVSVNYDRLVKFKNQD